MRLDRFDSYLTEFHAEITGLRNDDRGTWLRLDRSAFYPTAGGQPHDTGILVVGGATLKVVDVQVEDGLVWHLVQGAATPGVTADLTADLTAGLELTGRIDWQRRYRHMQRHTAQHILSQALVRVNAEYGTRSVSMRGPESTIDFGGTADLQVLAAVELEANAAARRALAVMTFEVHDSRLGEYKLRRPAKVSGQVRLVAIGDYDLVACGGTHLRSSAEALPIKIVGLERVKGGLNRLTFRAGEEAHEDYALKHAVAAGLSVRLSVPAGEIVARVDALQAELAEQGRLLAEARAARAAALAQKLAAEAAGGYISAYLQGADAELLDPLIDHLQQAPGSVSLLAAAEGGSDRVRFAFLTGPGSTVDVRPLLKAALEPLGGRGGGRPDRAQGAAQADESRARAALAAAAAQLAR